MDYFIYEIFQRITNFCPPKIFKFNKRNAYLARNILVFSLMLSCVFQRNGWRTWGICVCVSVCLCGGTNYLKFWLWSNPTLETYKVDGLSWILPSIIPTTDAYPSPDDCMKTWMRSEQASTKWIKSCSKRWRIIDLSNLYQLTENERYIEGTSTITIATATVTAPSALKQ